ncbi:hypothetical protein ZIOFF_001594 [Zingiber officinale]|uniref:Uncharacterized protein n=1 Tax=Zingiber officinale TaxID=94328 RepID=A0A8J5LYK9_ZINOF|nr:hypothetical protein ZIOFF_001594 [Zingiber officinale]
MASNDEDFEEEEVWATAVDRRDQPSPKQSATGKGLKCHTCATTSTRSLSSGARMIPCGRTVSRSSAPVSIPDWSKIYKHGRGTHAEETGGRKNDDVNDDEEEGDNEDDRAPPHEWLAKKMAKTQISSSSVCEGAGRTLKGRDLSKVRNAVLTKTGFLE